MSIGILCSKKKKKNDLKRLIVKTTSKSDLSTFVKEMQECFKGHENNPKYIIFKSHIMMSTAL